MMRRLALAAAAALLSACADGHAPTAPAKAPPARFAVSDGAHGGNGRLYFLPPLAPATTAASGTLEAAALTRLVVSVVALDPAGNPGAEVARIQSTANAQGDVLTIRGGGGSFGTDWRPHLYGATGGVVYRVRVLLDGAPIGFADVTIEVGPRLWGIGAPKRPFVSTIPSVPVNEPVAIRFVVLATTTPPSAPAANLMQRYVALGHSIPAGTQSGGINRETQLQAYPALLARMAGTPFESPLMAMPGCPAPMASPLGPRISDVPCAGREGIVPIFFGHAARPGVTASQLLTLQAGFPTTVQNIFPSITLTTPTQLDMVRILGATFVTLQIGDNEFLGPVSEGRLPPHVEGDPFISVLGTLASIPTLRGGAIIGVFDPTTALPLLQPGAFFFLARDVATGRFSGKPVNANCSPVTPLGQPNPLARNLVSFRILADAALPEINCDPAAQGGRHLFDQVEIANIRAQVAAVNNLLSTGAGVLGWAYVDPNAMIAASLAARDAAGRFQAIRKCQLLETAATAAQFQAAVLNSCPVTGPTAAPNMFGSLISFDAVHPSAAGQQLLATALAQAINARYGTTLPTP